jgi:hypothetical protein
MSEDMRKALEGCESWLTAALECKEWSWDADQHEAATESRDAARAALTSSQDGWRAIESCETWRYDHMSPMLAHWKRRGVRETYWDVDDEFDSRPVWWSSPREGWRSPGDQCIPINQDDVTLWRPLPPPPVKEMGL